MDITNNNDGQVLHATNIHKYPSKLFNDMNLLYSVSQLISLKLIFFSILINITSSSVKVATEQLLNSKGTTGRVTIMSNNLVREM